MSASARGWPVVPPDAAGFDPAALAAAIDRFADKAGRDGVQRLAVLHEGRLIHAGPQAHLPQGVWSITKTVLTTTMGLLVDDGVVALDAPVARVLPELAPAFVGATFRHFGAMISGYRASGDELAIKGYEHGPSRTFFLPAAAPQSAPGSTFSYWDSAPNLLALALTRMAGESLDALFGRRIARPLGMNLEWGRWLIGDLRVNGGAGNHFGMVQTSCLDICKLGELYRLGGVWAGERLLSRDWCTLATSVQARADLALHGTLFDGRGRYGLFWWVNGIGPAGDRKWKGVEPGAFSASGYNNNDLFVLPQAGIVACRLGTDQDFDGAVTDEIYAELLRDIVAAGNGSRGGTADG